MNESAHPIVDELRTREPVPLDVARAIDGVPAEPGFYAWWLIDGAALPEVPLDGPPPHLLYVGIAPSRATSRATLRSRVLGNHIGGNLAARSAAASPLCSGGARDGRRTAQRAASCASRA